MNGHVVAGRDLNSFRQWIAEKLVNVNHRVVFGPSVSRWEFPNMNKVYS